METSLAGVLVNIVSTPSEDIVSTSLEELVSTHLGAARINVLGCVQVNIGMIRMCSKRFRNTSTGGEANQIDIQYGILDSI